MLTIRPATKDDASLLATMILELAEYEHLAHEAAVTAESIMRRVVVGPMNVSWGETAWMAWPTARPS